MYKQMELEDVEMLKSPNGRAKLILKYRNTQPTLTTDPSKLRVNVFYDSLTIMQAMPNGRIRYTWCGSDGLIERSEYDVRWK